MKTFYRPRLLILAAILALMGAALAQYAITSPRVINFAMGDIYFEVDGERNAPVTLQAGEVVTFVVSNHGGLPHNVQFGRDLDMQTRRYNEELFPGFAGIDLDPGQTARLTLQIPNEPGTWEIGCLILGHHEAGQRIVLNIE